MAQAAYTILACAGAASGCNAPEGECAGTCMVTAPRPAVHCRVGVISGKCRHRYSGLFASARAAFDDADSRFPEARYIGVLRGAAA